MSKDKDDVVDTVITIAVGVAGFLLSYFFAHDDDIEEEMNGVQGDFFNDNDQ